VTVLSSMDDLARWLADRAAQVDAMPEDDSTQVQAKAKAFDDYHNEREYLKERLELDLWTAAFFWTLPRGEAVPKADAESMLAPTQQELIQLRKGSELDARLVEKVRELAKRLNFFHWELAFPNVFSGEKVGFDCVLANPPWERIKLQEEEFFASRDPQIATAANKAARQKLITDLAAKNAELALDFEYAKHVADATSKFIRFSNRFELTAVGDMNTYSLFMELERNLLQPLGRAGGICPPGIASDDTNKLFFADLVNKGSLVSLISFVNEKNIFIGVVHNFRFCILTLAGSESKITNSLFAYECESLEDMKQKERFFRLPKEDLSLFNPNTMTAPAFRTDVDSELNRAIYRRVGVFVEEATGKNPWTVQYSTMLHMSNDSGLFVTQQTEGHVRLFESKMIHQYDHRFGSFESIQAARTHMLPNTPLSNYQRVDYFVRPWYWFPEIEVESRLNEKWSRKWLFGFRDITMKELERTAIFTILPREAYSDPFLIFQDSEPLKMACLLGSLNSLTFDYCARLKVGGTHLKKYILYQLPVLPPSTYAPVDIDFIAPRVLELVYTAYDLRPFAEDMGYHGEPFRWDVVRRAQLRAELDAYYARLYRLTRDELRYILDPKEVYGEDFPGETFRVLKEKEIKQFGEYRTRRLALEAWDSMESGIERVRQTVQPLEPAIEFPAEIAGPIPGITWIPVDLSTNQFHLEQPTPIQRQTYAFAWLLVNFGTGRSIPSYDAQKYSYFLQRTGIADLEISYKEFARGPYSPQLTYKAGTYAKKQGFWEALGKNIARRPHIGKAVNAAEEIFADVQQARRLVEQLEKMSKDDLGGLATVDFAARKVFEKTQTITPENIRAYFLSDWVEKMNDRWYTDENINRAIALLSELGLFLRK
jgi:hypothetical protein